ncbi:energy-coupling factor ABC transporter ATP-binding protein [Bacillus marinisedimentorum]|uniref:energy-coupling factor ABC transporter ATP-binding protein n=1 Tax=Bacillus marinisedimentorum TaxID=1821260 RepID=UPI0008724CA9|nr:energy-coupling factor ABC transporter ATP-binding protein [Bacillus marinisedimentorum]
MEIKITNLEHRYMPRTPFERLALHDVTTHIDSGTFLAVIGHTGSGKSTLVQHLNGLLKPTSGEIRIGETVITADKKDKSLKPLRKKAGIVFQYPEHQLFEETVEKDVMFGPRNFGVPEEKARKKARETVLMLGLPEDVLQKSPFDLSGGQMRRVAIAGVLAMEPEILILDEPTAGLDPKGRHEIMDMFSMLHKQRGLTTILVTHSMEDAARYADEIAVMDKGTLVARGAPQEIFSNPEQLIGLGLDVPETTRFAMELEEKFGTRLSYDRFTLKETADLIESLMRGGDPS